MDKFSRMQKIDQVMKMRHMTKSSMMNVGKQLKGCIWPKRTLLDMGGDLSKVSLLDASRRMK